MKREKSTIHVPFRDGRVLVGGDAHYWPGKPSTAHRAFVHFAKVLKPKLVVFNGDALDASTISRHPPIGWEELPTLEAELEVVQRRMEEIRRASPGARHIWPLGNHDARFNMRLAAVAPEYRGVKGTRLVHHFPHWEPCWAVAVGGKGGAIIKHRYKGGHHAPFNNTVTAGRTIVTGHHHSQKVTPFTDYNGTRYGVDTGCLDSGKGAQFNYNEDNPRDWRAGFAVLTWRNGTLLMPELVSTFNEKKGQVQWRGEIVQI